MTIRNFTTITNVALAVAVIALAAPMADAQSGGYGAAFSMVNNGGYNLLNAYNRGFSFGMVNNGGYNLLNSYNNSGSFYGYTPYSPYAFGIGAYRYNPGALVLGADGQLYNPSLGNGATEPTINADGITVPAPLVPALVPVAPTTSRRTSEQIDAVRLSGNRVRIEWTGDPRSVATMTFSLLDKNRAALKSTIMSDMPAQAVFTLPSNAAYYRVVINYSDGAVRSLVTAL